MNKTSLNYAEAMFSLAKEDGCVKEILENFQLFKNFFDDELKSFLCSYNIPKNTKKTLLKETLKDVFHKHFLNFLLVFVDSNKFKEYDFVFQKYEKFANEFLNIKVVEIYSANDLEKDIEKQLKDFFESKKDYTYVFKKHVNKDLISGFKLVIDDEVYDASLKNRLDKLKENLLEKGV